MARSITAAGVALAAMMLAPVPSIAQEPASGEHEPGVVAAGPLGVSYEVWAERWFRWIVGLDPVTEFDCQFGDQGDVLFLAGAEPAHLRLDCDAAPDQHILAVLGGTICTVDGLQTSIPNGKAKAKARKARQRLRLAQAEAYECLTQAGRDEWSDPVLWIDGESKAIDEAFWRAPGPFEFDFDELRFLDLGRKSVVIPGYYVMIEPLPPGTHVIEAGATHTREERTDYRFTAMVTVKERPPTDD